MKWWLAASISAFATLCVSVPLAAEVTVSQWLEPDRGIVARRQIDLYIEVATDGFFAGGTVVGEFEIPGVVVLRREQFAVNSTRNTDGVTWAVQRWKIALYPQESGRFEVPSIPLRVITGAAAQVTETATQPVSFDARLPEGLSNSATWVAVPALDVTERVDHSESELEFLKAGDAIVREIEMNSRDTVAMMLPELTFTAPAGVSVYRDPPRLEDSVNRGVSRSSRRETVTYVIEQAGRYRVPEIEILWWDTGTDELHRRTLPARIFSTEGFTQATAPVATAAEESADPGYRPGFLHLFAGISTLLLIVVGLRSLARKLNAFRRYPSLNRQLDQAARAGDPRRLVALLYRWLDVTRDREATGVIQARTLRCFIASLDQSEFEDARVEVMEATFGASEGTGTISARAVKTLRRITRQAPAAVIKETEPFALN